jgi:hypothetical protein
MSFSWLHRLGLFGQIVLAASIICVVVVVLALIADVHRERQLLMRRRKAAKAPEANNVAGLAVVSDGARKRALKERKADKKASRGTASGARTARKGAVLSARERQNTTARLKKEKLAKAKAAQTERKRAASKVATRWEYCDACSWWERRTRRIEKEAQRKKTQVALQTERDAKYAKIADERAALKAEKDAAAGKKRAAIEQKQRAKQTAAARQIAQAAARFASVQAAAARKSASYARTKFRKAAARLDAHLTAACVAARAAAGASIAAREAAAQFAVDAAETLALRAIRNDEAALADMASVNASFAAQGMAFAAAGYAKMALRATSEAVRKRKQLREEEDAAMKRFCAVVDGAVRVAKNATYDAFLAAQRAAHSAVAAGVEHRRKDAAMLYDLIGDGGMGRGGDIGIGVDAEDDEDYVDNVFKCLYGDDPAPATLEDSLGWLASAGWGDGCGACSGGGEGGSQDGAAGSSSERVAPPPSPGDAMMVGMSNRTGQNNCFLNVVVQALFHISAFRIPFLQLRERSAAEEGDDEEDDGVNVWARLRSKRVQPPTALFRALQETMLQLSASRTSLTAQSASGDEIRSALARGFSEFQLGEMSDAVEAHTMVLETLQSVFTMGSIVDGGGDGDSDLIDDCFTMHLRSTYVCGCGHTQYPAMEIPQLVDYVYVDQLISARNVRRRTVLERLRYPPPPARARRAAHPSFRVLLPKACLTPAP